MSRIVACHGSAAGDWLRIVDKWKLPSARIS
jgi:hypothetical protein